MAAELKFRNYNDKYEISTDEYLSEEDFIETAAALKKRTIIAQRDLKMMESNIEQITKNIAEAQKELTNMGQYKDKIEKRIVQLKEDEAKLDKFIESMHRQDLKNQIETKLKEINPAQDQIPKPE